MSLGAVTKWLAEQAEALGVEIFPGFAAAEVLYNEDGSVRSVATGNLGISKEGEPTDNFQLGMELLGKYTVFAEGARGHLGKQLIAKYHLDEGRDPQSFGIGIKELWEIDPKRHQPGFVMHTAGWPMENDTYGGAFLYHLEGNKVAVGFVTGLGYSNPTSARLKNSSAGRPTPTSATTSKTRRAKSPPKRLSYGARAINASGINALPRRCSRRRTGGLQCGLPQRGPHQGQPRRHQDRHAGRRSRL